jgi:hypothetical protein
MARVFQHWEQSDSRRVPGLASRAKATRASSSSPSPATRPSPPPPLRTRTRANRSGNTGRRVRAGRGDCSVVIRLADGFARVPTELRSRRSKSSGPPCPSMCAEVDPRLPSRPVVAARATGASRPCTRRHRWPPSAGPPGKQWMANQSIDRYAGRKSEVRKGGRDGEADEWWWCTGAMSGGAGRDGYAYP